MSWLLLILLTLVIGVVTQWFIKYYKYEWYLKKYAGPSVLPLLGTVHHFRSFEGKLLFPIWYVLYCIIDWIIFGRYPTDNHKVLEKVRRCF